MGSARLSVVTVDGGSCGRFTVKGMSLQLYVLTCCKHRSAAVCKYPKIYDAQKQNDAISQLVCVCIALRVRLCACDRR